MKKTILFKTMLLLCAMLVGNAVNAADKWVKTDPTNFSTGDVVVIVDQTSSTAMSNDKGTSSAPAATTVSLNNDMSEITGDVATTLQWVVTVTNNTYQFGVGEDHLYCTNTNNGVRVGSNTNNVFTWVADPDNTNSTEPYLFNTATSRYIGVYNNSDWRCYSLINNNIKKTVTAFYKKTDPNKQDVTLSFPQESYDADIAGGADSFEAPELTKGSDVDVTYSSSNTSVATVDVESGEVTLVGKGVTTIKANFAGNDTYNPASASYTLTVINSNENDGSLEKPFTVAEARENTPTTSEVYIKGIVSAFYADDIISDGNNYRYYISDDGTTTDQLLVYKGKNLNNEAFVNADDIEIGDHVIIYGKLTTYNKDSEIDAGNYIYSTDHKNREDAGLVVEEDFEMEVTTTKPVEDVYEMDSDGEVTITSDNEAVVKVENGLLKALSVGKAVITVSVAKTETYKAASANFTVKVRAETAVEPEGQGAGSSSSYFVKVTSTDDITNGNYLIVYESSSFNDVFNGNLETLDAEDNGFSVTIEDNTIAATQATLAAVFTIDVTNRTLKSASGKYIGVSSNSNGLKSSENAEDYTNSFAIDEDGNAVISAVFETSTMTLRYNKASNQNRFRYYKSGQEPIQLYKYVEVAGENTFNIAVSEAGWRGLVTAVDATLPEGLTAYTVADNDGTTVTLNETFTVKANTPYIVKGNEGTYTLTVAEEEVEAPENNLLQISTQNTGNGVYVLYNGASGVGFYLWSGGSLGAGRVYLPAIVNAREFIGFETETTGISTVNSEAKSLFNGEFFNMAGQRVAKPAKGLYIVNGKKVVIK